MNIYVIPKDFYEIPPMICGFNYTIQSLILSESAVFNVMLFDQFSNILKIDTITISGDDYTKWGNDDNYIVEFICKNFDLTPAKREKTTELTPVIDTPGE